MFFSYQQIKVIMKHKYIILVTSPTLEILLANPFLEEIPISAILNLG